MIRLDRSGLTPTPQLVNAQTQLMAIADQDGKDLANDKGSAAAWLSMRPTLMSAQRNKCGWCESLLDDAAIEIDHIRPKNRTRYWWLAFELPNLLASCRSCNNKKRSKWPLMPGVHRLSARDDPSVVAEDSAVVNPTVEDPEPHLDFQDLGGKWRVVGQTFRGEQTVEVLALDRDGLSRKLTFHAKYTVEPVISRALGALEAGDRVTWVAAQRELAQLCAEGAPYSAMTKVLVRRAFT